jgi:hypothetical protein
MSNGFRWFDEGASKLRLFLGANDSIDILPSNEPFYMCPCCLQLHPRSAALIALTREHVPPDKLGGNELLLTCFDCNNRSGSTFDKDAKTQNDVENLINGVDTSRVMRIRSTAEGQTFKGSAQRTKTGIQIFGRRGAERNEEQKQYFAALDQMVENADETPDVRFQFVDKFFPWRTLVSWTRSAYLAVFAALGWTFIFQPETNPIRVQLMDPDNYSMPRIIAPNPTAQIHTRLIQLTSEPVDLKSITVLIGKYVVFLPDPTDPRSLEQLAFSIESRRSNAKLHETRLTGHQIPWPTKPVYRWDPS